jgi:hypothetical protein
MWQPTWGLTQLAGGRGEDQFELEEAGFVSQDLTIYFMFFVN